MKNIYLFDIDGTLADNRHRLHYMERDEIDWDEFEKQCVKDIPIEATCTIAAMAAQAEFQVWLWTARSENVRKETEQWMRNAGVHFDQLLMRPIGEDIPGIQLKYRWLKDQVPGDRVICAFEDVSTIIGMLRDNGLTVLQVKLPVEGD